MSICFQKATLLNLLAAPFVLSLASLHGARAAEWQPLAPLQLARQETGAAQIGDSVYVVGGLVVSGPTRATATVEVYSLLGGGWTYTTPLPTPLDHASVAAANGRLFVVGGYSGDFTPRDEVWIYDPLDGEWTPGASLPEPRGAAWAVELGGRIYLFGGVGPAGVSRTTFIYDPALDAWSSGADMPTRREHLNAVAAGSFIYVVGGRNGPSTAANERYDSGSNQWMSLAPMPTARSAMALGVIDGVLYAAGGERPVLFAVNEAYDIANNVWSTSAPMAVPRHGVAAVSIGNWILAPGGGTVQGLGPTAHVDRFVSDPSGVVQTGGKPARIRLLSSFPNPFTASTSIPFFLASSGFAHLAVYDPGGRRVRTLLARPLSSGSYVAVWDGLGETGSPVAAGVYVLRLAIPGEAMSGKVIVSD
jgi:hypothetical protein